MESLIKKSIFILRNYGLRVFLIKATKWPLNRIKQIKQKFGEAKAKKNPSKVIIKLKNFTSNNPEEIFDFAWNFYSGLI